MQIGKKREALALAKKGFLLALHYGLFALAPEIKQILEKIQSRQD